MRKIRVEIHPNMPMVGFRMPDTVVDYVAQLSRKELRNRSDIFRCLVVEALVARGVVEVARDLEGEAA